MSFLEKITTKTYIFIFSWKCAFFSLNTSNKIIVFRHFKILTQFPEIWQRSPRLIKFWCYMWDWWSWNVQGEGLRCFTPCTKKINQIHFETNEKIQIGVLLLSMGGTERTWSFVFYSIVFQSFYLLGKFLLP